MCPTNMLLMIVAILISAIVLVQYFNEWIAFDNFLKDLDAKRTGFNSGAFIHEGKTYKLSYGMHQRYSNRTTLKIIGEGKFSGRLSIRLKGAIYDLDPVIFSLSHKIELDNADLNNLLHVESDNDALAQIFLDDQEVVQIVKDLLQIFDSINIQNHQCFVSVYKESVLSNFDNQSVRDIAHKILILIQHIPQFN